MTSGFKKIIIIIFIVFAVLLSLAASVVFFPKERNRNILNQDNQQEERQSNDSDNKQEELTEEERVKIMAETFAGIYYSYVWGNFSNIESQYYYMTDEMKNREENRVAGMKKEMENQPQKYFTVRAEIVKSNFIEYISGVKASLNIKLEIKEINGAFVTMNEVPEIKPYTSALVDSNKKVYFGNIEDLVVNTINKNIEINLIKSDNKWKVNEIK